MMGLIRNSLVDLKNGLPPRPIAEKFYARGIIFVHVPKCAGTSVEKALRAKYRLSRVSIAPETSFATAARLLDVSADPDTRNDILIRASELRRDMLQFYLSSGYKCITGHAPVSLALIRQAKSTHDFATVLRDPVERYLSHVQFNMTDRSGHGKIEMDLIRFLDTPRAQIMGSLYGKYFSGLPMTADFSSSESVEASKATLEHIAVVGFLDNIAEFTADLTCHTGKSIRIGHENKTQKDQSNFSQDVIDRVTSLCASDIEIYHWAREHFAPISD